MDISAIVNNLVSQSYLGQSTAQGSSQAAAQGSADPVTAALKKANDRVGQQLESAKVQLSAYGQIKGAVAGLQAASKSLSNTKQTATTEGVKKVAAEFVAAYNKANQAVGAATQSSGKEVGALSGDARARLVGSDLRRAVNQGDTLANLKQIGITQNKDGSLAVDTKALANALNANPDQVRSTLANVGSQVDKTAGGELASTGNVGKSVNALSTRSRNLETQQNAQQEQTAAAQRLIDQQNARLDNAFASGAAAYLRTFLG